MPIDSIVRSLSGKSKPIIDISLNDQQRGVFVPSYTTLDKIDGHITIRAPNDTPFQNILVAFQGTCNTYVEKIASTATSNSKSRTTAFHKFLSLIQPIDGSIVPPNRILKAGETYKIPFNFVVPENLLPQSCTHSVENGQIHQAHLELPPSLGDPMLASDSDGKTLLDDLAPDMVHISYALRVMVTSPQDANHSKKTPIVDSLKKIRIIPAVDEWPPLSVSGGKVDDYTLRTEKDLRKGFLKGKLGRLVIEAQQPKSLRIPPPRSDNSCPITTMATVNVRFDPAEETAQPPRLGRLINKLKIATFYASAPVREFPKKTNTFLFDNNRGLYADSMALSSRCVEAVSWEAHDPANPSPPRWQDHIFSASTVPPPETPAPSSAYNGKTFYTAKVLVPIHLPRTKTFVPTFHSCLVSRIYALDMSLSVHTPSVSATTLHLKIPLQISSERNPDAQPMISEQEAQAMADRDVDLYLAPRSLSMPAPEYAPHLVRRGGGNRASDGNVQPPDYSLFSGRPMGPALGAVRETPLGNLPAYGYVR
ncbi:hypothetical protein MMC20_005246 [Loxospora ochrophaea]|nr:hypothetical protein [Loxospora ochrophaea]